MLMSIARSTRKLQSLQTGNERRAPLYFPGAYRLPGAAYALLVQLHQTLQARDGLLYGYGHDPRSIFPFRARHDLSDTVNVLVFDPGYAS